MGERIAIPEGKLCTAHKASTGEPCKNAAIRGGKVCPAHGGSASQVREAATQRLLAMVDPALTALLEIVNDTEEKLTPARLAAAKDILDRAGLVAVQKVDANLTVHSAEEVANMAASYLAGAADSFDAKKAEEPGSAD